MQNFEYKTDNNKFVIFMPRIESEIDYNNIKELSQLIDKGVEEGFDVIYIDCTNLIFIDSSGLGRLIVASKKAKISLINMNKEIKKVFQYTNLLPFFKFE